MGVAAKTFVVRCWLIAPLFLIISGCGSPNSGHDPAVVEDDSMAVTDSVGQPAIDTTDAAVAAPGTDDPMAVAAPALGPNEQQMQNEIDRLKNENEALRNGPAVSTPKAPRYALIGNFGNRVSTYDEQNACLDAAYRFQRSLDEDCNDPEKSQAMKLLACQRPFRCVVE